METMSDEQSDSPMTTDLCRRLLHSIVDYAIVGLDVAGHVVTWNTGAERMHQFTSADVAGRSFSLLFQPTDSDRGIPARILETAAQQGRGEIECELVRKDGSRFRAHIVMTPLRDDAGAIGGFALVSRLMGDQRRAVDGGKRDEDRFRLIVQSIRDYAIFMLDPTGHILSWNAGAQRFKGYTANEIIGRHFSVFYPEEDAAKPARELEIATKEGRFEEEGWRLRKDGSRFWANVVITALRDDSGTLVGFAKVTRDLTERRMAQEQAIADLRRVAESEAANRAKSEFLMAMSHELRTPLNAIGGYAELLALGLGGDVTDRQREYLERIRKSQQHLMGLINDVLSFSRIEGGKITYDVTAVSMSSVVDTVLPMIEPQAAAKHLSITRHPGPEAVACADRGKVEQILINLLSNSVKYTEDGGRIDVSYGIFDGEVEVRVRDSGIGIPEDKLSAIFEPFFQVGRSFAVANEGTGLGLAISRDLARAMRGDLTVESAMGEGATFTLRLPAE